MNKNINATEKKSILGFGTLPTSDFTSGAAEAFSSLFTQLENTQFKVKKINYAKFSFAFKSHINILASTIRFLDTIYTVFAAVVLIPFYDLIYICLSRNLLFFLARDLPIVLLSKLFMKKSVAVYHGGSYFTLGLKNKLQRKIFHNLLNLLDAKIIISATFVSDYNFMKHSKLHIIQNSPPSQEFDLINKQLCRYDYLSISPRKNLNLLFLSNLMHEKGYLELVDSVITLNYSYKLNVVFNLHICGSFSSTFSLPKFSNHLVNLHGIHRCKTYDSIQKFIKNIDSMDSIKFYGHIDSTQKLNFLSSSDIYCLPTYYLNEGLPISAIEAMAYGMPIVGTPWKGMVDIIDENHNGFFVEPHNTSSIVHKLLQFTTNPSLLQKMGANSLLKYKEFSFSRNLQSYIKLFDSLLS
ncbi:glycosyltransferase [Synechococcus sp. UW140]|uniref:glycosyltransferase family 4 protein n=1 Tax=Synechococcus sp. UW140 TaxID=368503 RepID=UPI000E0E484A|nr:glycosyltransferase [Synechococcus sp. UW140]